MEEDLDLWCTRCGDKDPTHLRSVEENMGCRTGEVSPWPRT